MNFGVMLYEKEKTIAALLTAMNDGKKFPGKLAASVVGIFH